MTGGGRHRYGVPYSPVGRRRWDERQRAQAAHLDAQEPGWSVLYGVWSRSFFAFAVWPAARGVVVDARTPEALREAMREAEALGAEAWSVIDDVRHSRTRTVAWRGGEQPPSASARRPSGCVRPEEGGM